MELKITSEHIFKFLNVLAWIIFIGLCIEAGGFLFNSFYTLAYNPIGARYFWNHLDFSSLYNFDTVYLTSILFFVCGVVVLKALLFYYIVKLFYDKKFKLKEPFNTEVGSLFFKMSYITLFIGILIYISKNTFQWLIAQNVHLPNKESLHLSGGDVWLLMSVILYVIAHIFKRGIELQEENELTI